MSENDAEGKAAFTAPVEDPKVSDGDLDKAAAAAITGDEAQDDPIGTIQEESTQEDATISTQEEDTDSTQTNGDGLPIDHKVRSDLGRKFSALHRRQDEFDSKLDKLLDALTSQKQEDPIFDNGDEVLTKAEAAEYFKKWQASQAETENKIKQKYQNSYDDTLIGLSSDYSDEETGAIFNELQNMRYNPTGDGARDAEINFLKAERAYLRKKTANKKKDVPLKQDPVSGVITKQKAQVRDVPEVKLNAAGKSYLDYVAKKDGVEKANSLRKSLNA